MRLPACLVAMFVPMSASAAVTIVDATDEGLDCFEVTTPSATYYYDKAGAGFTSLLDRDGVDWIGFRPEGTSGVPNGQSGWYRGIPNMGLNAFGHPGYTGATSTTPDTLGVAHDRVQIESSLGSWQVRWTFDDDHARMEVLGVGENYWYLYEGTPGGAVGADDNCIRPDGTTTSLASSWEGDVVNATAWAPGSEWVLFADGTQDRSLFLMHEDDALVDRYYLMDPMTVFGFGRHTANLDRLMSQTPASLLFGLLETRDVNVAGPILHTLWTSEVPTDGGSNDDGSPDGGSSDDGGPDGGSAQDGAPDGGQPDGGDARRPSEGGDQRAPADSTSGDARTGGESPVPGGQLDGEVVGSCSCRAANPLALVALLLCRRRRRTAR